MKSIVAVALLLISVSAHRQYYQPKIANETVAKNQTDQFLTGFVYGLTNYTVYFTNFTNCSSNQSNKTILALNQSMSYLAHHRNYTSQQVHATFENWADALKYLYVNYTMNCSLNAFANLSISLIKPSLQNNTNTVNVPSPGVIYINGENISWRFNDTYNSWNISNWTQMGLDIGYITFLGNNLTPSFPSPKGYVELSF